MPSSTAPRTTAAAIAAALVTAVITTLSVTTFTLGGGTAIDKLLLTSSVVNVDPVTAGSVTTSRIAVTGAAIGDHVSISIPAGDLGGSTSTMDVTGKVVVADFVDVKYLNTANTSTQASFNAGASTLSILVVSP